MKKSGLRYGLFLLLSVWFLPLATPGQGGAIAGESRLAQESPKPEADKPPAEKSPSAAPIKGLIFICFSKRSKKIAF